jgi:hypothetical protein
MSMRPRARTALLLGAWIGLAGCVLVPDRGAGPVRDNDRHDRLVTAPLPFDGAPGRDYAPARLPSAMAGPFAAPQLRPAILYAWPRRALRRGVWA